MGSASAGCNLASESGDGLDGSVGKYELQVAACGDLSDFSRGMGEHRTDRCPGGVMREIGQWRMAMIALDPTPHVIKKSSAPKPAEPEVVRGWLLPGLAGSSHLTAARGIKSNPTRPRRKTLPALLLPAVGAQLSLTFRFHHFALPIPPPTPITSCSSASRPTTDWSTTVENQHWIELKDGQDEERKKKAGIVSAIAALHHTSLDPLRVDGSSPPMADDGASSSAAPTADRGRGGGSAAVKISARYDPHSQPNRRVASPSVIPLARWAGWLFRNCWACARCRCCKQTWDFPICDLRFAPGQAGGPSLPCPLWATRICARAHPRSRHMRSTTGPLTPMCPKTALRNPRS